jgi:hypothetical protein
LHLTLSSECTNCKSSKPSTVLNPVLQPAKEPHRTSAFQSPSSSAFLTVLWFPLPSPCAFSVLSTIRHTAIPHSPNPSPCSPKREFHFETLHCAPLIASLGHVNSENQFKPHHNACFQFPTTSFLHLDFSTPSSYQRMIKPQHSP